ncbi:hypothetical protein GTR04_5506 [Trichophyton interdigitale]|uniref:Uncharacterized protein n=1 Tax=Trichophyton interdigitale TaxID=101480 RepID=A0A9P4YJ71_9EURO|nr:hypothetical protein GY632_2447 [Trichophyton interdigitale]KAG5210842.1 hypothetical protein GY631_5100 [Trichophyton interdigitale]KAG8207122.1 hypothetical protein GTR04_5506 [Trichophyton interdigitale]
MVLAVAVAVAVANYAPSRRLTNRLGSTANSTNRGCDDDDDDDDDDDSNNSNNNNNNNNNNNASLVLHEVIQRKQSWPGCLGGARRTQDYLNVDHDTHDQQGPEAEISTLTWRLQKKRPVA